jgi:hypothetical protein
MNNPFLDANLTTIERTKTHLLELEMMGSYQDVPLSKIRFLFDGLVLEISKLQGEVDEIKKLIPKASEVKDEQKSQTKRKGKGK